MGSSRLADGLRCLARNDYDEAVSHFHELITSQVDNPIQNGQILYFYAVSNLGALLNISVNDKKSDNKPLNVIKTLLFENKTSDKSSLNSIKIQEDKFKIVESKIAKTTKELDRIRSLFEAAKKAMQPKSIEGIEYAVNVFIKNIYKINQSECYDKTKCFFSELKKFKMLYSTKLFLSEELDSIDKSSIFRFFSPEIVKQLRKIFDNNKDDPLFLSYEQINQLYKQQKAFQYNEKYKVLFNRLENCLLLSDDKDYIEICSEYKGDLDFNKTIIFHSIYEDKNLKNLHVIIKKLNDNNLLNEKILNSLAEIAFPSSNYRDSVKYIADIITSSNFVNKNKLLVNFFDITLNQIPYQSLHPYQFNKYISYIKSKCIFSDEKINVKVIYVYLDLLTLLSIDKDVLLNLVCDLMKETENAIGSENFIALCERILKYKMLHTDFIIIMNFVLQLRSQSAKDILQLIDQNHSDLDVLKERMHDVLIKDYELKYPERPLEDVIHDFLTKSNDVEYPIDKTEMKQLAHRYMQIKTIGDELIMKGCVGIQLELAKCKRLLNKNSDDEIAQLTLLAIIRLQVKEKLGINPYNMQMLNVLALLHQPKRIAQIKTGEGKSALIAILAAYSGLMNHKVDIITTSHDLAIRDVKKFDAFYRSLGLKVGHNTEGQNNNNVYDNNDIVYGTVSDFEFAYLRGESNGEASGRGNRPYDVVIADEVDSMLIDMQRNEAILSHYSDDSYKPEVYQDIWNWVNKVENKDQTRENLQKMLKSKGVEINFELATTWLRSAKTAKLYSEDKEYIIDYPKSKSRNRHKDDMQRIIKIVNKSHTGEVQGESTRWQGGLHEILEAKHKLQVRVECLTDASINHIEFFNKYKILKGLTGTLGSSASRDELNTLYNVKTYDSPPYKPSLKKQISHLVEKDEKAQMSAIYSVVKKQIDAGRPVLILCESIQESKNFNQYLSKKIKSIQVYNGLQENSADIILGLAGNPKVVTIATNLAGRGSDIVTTPDVESKGGLHVIMTFPAINLRVEKQAFGRTGRQGKEGTYHYIIHQGQLSDLEKMGKTIDEKIAVMRDNREIREKDISTNNILNYNITHKLFILQTLFFALPTPIKSKHMLEWAKFKTEANKRANEYVYNELDDEDLIIVRIIEKFNDFWQKTLTQSPIDFIKKRLKRPLQDEYVKRQLIEAALLLENPEFDFSIVVEPSVNSKLLELMSEEEISYDDSDLIRFYQSKVNDLLPSIDEKTSVKVLR